MKKSRGGRAAPKPCFGDWHPGKRLCWRCEFEKKCYAIFDKKYGAVRWGKPKVKK